MRTRTAITTAILTLGLMLGLAASAQAQQTSTHEGSEAEVLAGTGYTWNNPANISNHGELYAEGTEPNNQATKAILAKNFHFGVLPADATINGVSVGFNANIGGVGAHVDFTAQLVKAGLPWGTATTDNDFGTGENNTFEPQTLPNWQTPPTVAELASPTFGVEITASRAIAARTLVRQLAVTVAYTVPRPNWLVNQAKLLVGAEDLVVLWGTPTLTSGANAYSCPTSAVATIKNEPAGGKGGIGAWASLCSPGSAPTCEAKGTTGFVRPTGEVSWAAVLTEPVTENLIQISGLGLEAGCKGSPGQSVTGSLTAKVFNGNSIGSGPAHLIFQTSELGGPTVTGSLRMMGFEGGEVIGAK